MTGEGGRIEQPLTGGRATAGVVRVGETVRRPKRENAALTRALLLHLERIGCDVAPRYLGEDSQGRETLSFVDGMVEPRLRDYDDAPVAAAARLLRHFHDATRGHPLAAGGEVVCHFDCGPYNAIFREGVPFAWIDFDMAQPGRAVDDVAYLAWMWCISSQAKRAPLSTQCRQVALVAESYGLDTGGRHALVEAIIGRTVANIAYWEAALRDLGRVIVNEDQARASLSWSHDERDHVQRHRRVFEEALGAL